MKKPLTRWLIFSVSLLITISALAWITTRALALEEQHRQSESDAKTREQVRLALWRMEAEASSVIVRESTRPAAHYESVTNSTSPLLGVTPDLVQLHFQCYSIPSPGILCSPQLPDTNETSPPNNEFVKETEARMQRLKRLLQEHSEWEEVAGFEVTKLVGKTGTAQFKISDDKLVPIANSNSWSLSDQTWRDNSLIKQPIRESLSLTSSEAALKVSELRPVWLDTELVLLRRVTDQTGLKMQGVWLDWPTLENRLLASIEDLLPAATLIPIRPSDRRDDWRALVSLPLRVEPGELPVANSSTPFGLTTSLTIAWICLLGAMAAIFFVLRQTERLSEKRATFVSAVTHELRTPMTTFRLYSQMLAEDAVTEPERRKHYLQTLCDESDRLMRLIDNVLAFSGIEHERKSPRQLQSHDLGELVSQLSPRLQERCDSAGLTLAFRQSDERCEVETDALTIEQILSNLIDNAIKYAAPDSEPREVQIEIQHSSNNSQIIVRDFGPGLSTTDEKRLFQPFSKSASEAAVSAPGIGLGLALCHRLARSIGGTLKFIRPSGRGAQFVLSLPHRR